MLLTRGSSLYLKKMIRFLIRLIISVLPIRVIAGGWCYVSKYRWVRAISKYLSQYLSSLLRRLYTFIQHWECLVLYFYRYVLFTARTFYDYPVVSKFVRKTALERFCPVPMHITYSPVLATGTFYRYHVLAMYTFCLLLHP